MGGPRVCSVNLETSGELPFFYFYYYTSCIVHLIFPFYTYSHKCILRESPANHISADSHAFPLDEKSHH